MAVELPELLLADVTDWEEWLAAHHGQPTGVWLVLAKKGVTDPTHLTYDEALEVALCHGWIDGQVRGRDGATFFQRFTPRRPRSVWSQRNVGLVTRLTADGRMKAAGVLQVEQARADGRWDVAYRQADAPVPEDFAAAIAADADAAAMFTILSSQNRFALLFRLGNVKRAETRTRRIEQFVAMLARGETIYPQKRTRSG